MAKLCRYLTGLASHWRPAPALAKFQRQFGRSLSNERTMWNKYGAPLRRLGRMAPCLALVLSGTLPVPAHAEDYPVRPVKIVVPFPAGGTADVVPRILGEWLARKWGQSVII